MRNFARVVENVPTVPLLNSLAMQGELWKPLRTDDDPAVWTNGSVDVIWLRRPILDLVSGPAPDPRESTVHPPWMVLPHARFAILDIARIVEAERIGGVSLIRLAPSARFSVTKHSGYYSKYHLSLKWLPGAAFNIDAEFVEARPGDVWYARSDMMHRFANDSVDDQIFMIIELRNLR